jgi:chromosome segregation ATPase
MNKTRTIANATNNNNNVKKSSTAIVGSSNTGTASKSASALKQQLDEQQAQLASLRAHCRTLETQLDAKHSALLALEQQQQQQHQSQPQPHKASAADAHERDVVQLARQVVAERTTLAKMKAEKARITGEIANKSNELASQKKQIAKLKATNDALELKCTQAEGAMVCFKFQFHSHLRALCITCRKCNGSFFFFFFFFKKFSNRKRKNCSL